MEQIIFETEEGEETFYVLDETRISGRNYLLVTNSEEDDEEGEALILKDISDEQDAEAVYVPVEDETELSAVAKVFEESLGDVDLQM